MTPTEIITEVLDELERPDLETFAVQKFPAALKICHGFGMWKRDLKILPIAEVDFAPVANNIVIQLPLGIRRLLRVETYSGTPGVLLDYKFEDLRDRVEAVNYFGFVNPQTYNIFGSTLAVNGISTNAVRMDLRCVTWPTFTYDGVLGEYVSDSWILLEFPHLIKAALKMQLARLTQQDDVINSSTRELTTVRSELLTTYYEDMVNELHS